MNVFNDEKALHKLVFTKVGTHDTLAVMPFFNAGQMVASEKLAKTSGDRRSPLRQASVDARLHRRLRSSVFRRDRTRRQLHDRLDAARQLHASWSGGGRCESRRAASCADHRGRHKRRIDRASSRQASSPRSTTIAAKISARYKQRKLVEAPRRLVEHVGRAITCTTSARNSAPSSRRPTRDTRVRARRRCREAA